MRSPAHRHIALCRSLPRPHRPRSKKKQRRPTADTAAADAAPLVGGASAEELSWLLRLRIVRALHRCFLHDRAAHGSSSASSASSGFLDADRFARLLPPLIAQLEAEPPPEAGQALLAPAHADPELASYVSLGQATRQYTAATGAHSGGPLGAAAVGCLLALGVAANSDAQWKPLNRQALMLTRSPAPRVRALGLEVAAQLAERLREVGGLG